MRNSIQNKTINTALLRSRSRRSLDRGDAQQAAQEHKEPQGDAQQVEEGGSGTWLHAGATKHRAKVAVHKDQVATALRQRKADAVATPKVAVDPDIAHCQRLNSRNGLKGQTLRRPQRVPSFAPEWIPDLDAGAPSDSPLRTFKI